MTRTLAVIAGAIILFVAALSASLAFIGKGSGGASSSDGPTPAQLTTGGSTGSHQMSGGSTMGGMDMSGTDGK